MTFLLDVNVLIALVDSAHLNHEAAHRWFDGGRDWATCPITENAFVRILANPAYPTVQARPSQVVTHLRALCQHPRHQSIAADASLIDATLFDATRIAGSRSVTDAYLVGLAHRHGMTLATFDRKLTTSPVAGAGPATVEQIPAHL